jgi:hypothetical protein
MSIHAAIRLSHDLQASAGQVLVQLASGQVHVVDPEVYEALVAPAPASKKGADKRAANKRAAVTDLLLRGLGAREAAARAGVPMGTVSGWRVRLVREGVVEAGPKTKSRRGRARKPYTFRSEETRERAREAGRRLQAKQRAQGAAE